jgi:DNA polymerase-3 subunit beta
MKFTIDQKEFSREVMAAARVVEAKTTIPMLSNLLIEADRIVSISGTDLEIAFESSCAAEIEEAGAVALPAKRLADYLYMSNPGPLKVQRAANMWTTITGAGSKLRLAGQSREAWPSLPKHPDDYLLEVDSATLASMLRKAMAGISTTDLDKYNVSFRDRVLLDMSDGALSAVGCDGSRLSVCNGVDVSFSGASQLVLSVRATTELIKLCESVTGNVSMAWDSNHIFFQLRERRFMVRQTSVSYPDYKILGQRSRFTQSAVLKVSDFKRSVDKGRAMADAQLREVNIVCETDSLRVISKTTDTCDIDEQVTAECSDAINLCVNSDMLVTFLSACESEMMTMAFSDSKSAIKLSGNGEKDRGHSMLVMPLFR